MDLGASSKAAAIAAAFPLLLLYLCRLNQIMFAVPKDALKHSPHRWTDDEIRETYERVCKAPIDLTQVTPPKLDRRYIVVGGSGAFSTFLSRLGTPLGKHQSKTNKISHTALQLTVVAGLVGGTIIQQLLARGQPAASIRIIDFVPPSATAAGGPAFHQADISSAAAATAAFTAPWPSPSIAALPLTVFHVAAVIRPFERSRATYHRVEAVNVAGTRHCLAAAATATAPDATPTVFIFTSSVSVAMQPVASILATPPWATHPRHALQFLDERDFDAPLRGREAFWANYAYSKAVAERLVAAANDGDAGGEKGAGRLRTGILRPGGGIYGAPRDLVFWAFLSKGTRNSTFAPQAVQNPVCAQNVGLAQLQFEAALAGDGEGAPGPACAGRPFVVTDSGPPPAWGDCYRAAEVLAVTPIKVAVLPPLPLYLLALGVEAWCGLLVSTCFFLSLLQWCLAALRCWNC